MSRETNLSGQTSPCLGHHSTNQGRNKEGKDKRTCTETVSEYWKLFKAHLHCISQTAPVFREKEK